MYRDRVITIVIPCLDEQEGLMKILSEIPSFVDEVVVVDNNSRDKTREIALKSNARVITETYRGYGWSCRKGLYAATGDIIVTLDGDYSYPINEVSRLVDYFIDNDLDFLSTSRFPLKDRKVMSVHYYIGNKLLSFIMSILISFPIRDSQSGMWLLTKVSLRKMQLVSRGMSFSEEIKMEAVMNKDIKFGEMHITYSHRIGKSKLHFWKDGFWNLLFLFRKRLLCAR